MRGIALWTICLCLGVLGLSRATAQAGGQIQVASGPRFLAPARGRPVTDAARWADASQLPVFRQQISIDVHDVPLGAALREVGQKAGLRITYSPSVIRADKRVTLGAKAITAGAALSALLYDAEVDVLLTPGGQAVVVRRGEISVLTGAVAGRVTDAKTGVGVAGAEVFLEKTHWRTTADTAGRYRLAEVDTGSYTLVVRRLGYAKQSRTVVVRDGATDTVNVVLEPVATKLDELVTTATGQQQRRTIANAITTINTDSVLRNAVARNVSDLLANRVTGLVEQHTSGAPGDPTKIRIRGIHSVYRSSDPIVFIDGIRVPSAQSDARSGNLTNLAPTQVAANGQILPTNIPAPSPLDQIDPNIIEKIEVVKGAAAATLYGPDAANGVILITTKRGKAGPTQWNASFIHGRTTTPGSYPTAFFRWGHDSLTGVPQFCVLAVTSCVVDSVVQFQSLNDPALTVLGRGHSNEVSLTASGGSRTLTYRVSGSYSADIGSLTLPAFEVDRFRALHNREAPDWMRRPHQLDNWSVSSAIMANLGSSAEVVLSTTLSREEQSRTSLETQIATLAGTYVDTLNGLYYRPGDGFVNGNPTAPYQLEASSAILSDYYIRSTASLIQLNTGLQFNWRPRTWLTAHGDAGVTMTPRNDQTLLQGGLLAVNDSGHLSVATGRELQSTFNAYATARKPLGLGFQFQTTVGVNLVTDRINDLAATASGLVPGTNSLSGASSIAANQLGSNTSSFGWFVEPQLVGQRISFSAGLQLAGGSAYGTRLSGSNGIGGLLKLPKIGGAWVISEEPWFPFRDIFQSLRLRGSYGQAQDQPGPTDRLRIYSSVPGQAGSELVITNIGNVNLRPERSIQFEGGFEGQLLDSRLSADVTWHHTKQVNAIMPATLPGSVHGGGTIFQNIGDVLTTGLELGASVTALRTPKLTWSLGVIYTSENNELIKLGPGVTPDPLHGLVEGFPVNSRWARPILGYGDQNGDGVLQMSEVQLGDSLVYMGRLVAPHRSTFNTNLSLFGGAVALTADVSYETGGTQVDETARTNWVLARGLVDPTTSFAEQAAVLASTRLVDPTDYGLTQDVSTLRFETLSLAYNAPTSVARLLRAQTLRVAVQGKNLAMHSTYSGGRDPDVSAWLPGNNVLDTGQIPQPRIWQLRFDVAY